MKYSLMKKVVLTMGMTLLTTLSLGVGTRAEGETQKYQVAFEKNEECLQFFGNEEEYEEVNEKSFAEGEMVSVFVVPESGLLLDKVYMKHDGETIEIFTKEEINFVMPEHDVVIQTVLKEPEFSEEDSKKDDLILGEFTDPKKEIKMKLTVGSKIRYGSYLTHQYSTGDDSYAYCLNPSKRTPKSGTYTGKLVTNKAVLRAAYYAYGGPGYEEFKKQVGTWGNGSKSNEYAMSHVMLAYVYGREIGGDANAAFRGMSSDAKSKLKSKISAMEKMPLPISGFYCYLMKTSGSNGNGNTQMMLCQCKRGKIKLTKKSANPTISNGNESYSLAGAVYGIYNGKGELETSITTDAAGNAGPSEYLPYGDYTVKETKPAKGYALDSATYRISINASTVDSSNVVGMNVTDLPQNQPMKLLLYKLDKETKKAKPQGAGSLKDAEFTVKFFEKQMEENPETKGIKPSKTWKFKTDEKGEIMFAKEYLCDGEQEEFYYQMDGKTICLPLGTVTIEETKAPQGYLRNPNIFVKMISSKGQAESVDVYQEQEVTEQVYRGDIELIKVGDGKLNRLASVPFKITSKTTGESYVIVTDKNGYASTKDSWNSHLDQTNRGETSQDGIWFGESVPEDGKGALIYDDYEIEEQPCQANEGMELLKIDFSVYRNQVVVPLGTLTDDAIEIPEEESEEEEPKEEEKEQEKPKDKVKKISKKTARDTVKTGDDKNLILLIIMVILSCTLLFTCDRIAHKD